MVTSVESIYNEVRNLNYEEQLNLLERIAGLIRQEGLAEKSGKQNSLLSLAGLGANHWQGVDIDAYIKGERAW